MTDGVDHERTLTAALEVGLERRDPTAPCLDGGDERWTRSDFVEQTRRVAGGLWNAGVRPGDRVAIYARGIPEQFVMAFATTRLGAIHLPVNAQWVGAEVRHVLTDAEPKVLVVDRATAAHAHSALAGSSVERVFVAARSRGDVPDGAGNASGGPAWAPFAELLTAAPFDRDLAAPGALAAAIYTSGTTGQSKAALSTHSEFLYNCLAWSGVAGLGPGDVGFGAYDGRGIALAVSFLGPLLSGVKLLVGSLVKRAWADTAASWSTRVSPC